MNTYSVKIESFDQKIKPNKKSFYKVFVRAAGDGTDFVPLSICYMSTLTIGTKMDTYDDVIKFINKELDTEVKYLDFKKKQEQLCGCDQDMPYSMIVIENDQTNNNIIKDIIE